MKKKIVMSGLIIVSFALLAVSFILFLDKAREFRKIDPLELEDMEKEDIIQYIYDRQAKSSLPNFYFIPIFGFFGIAVGALMYYILNGDIEKKEKALESNTEIILRLLNPDERRTVKKISELGGRVPQAEITYLEGFTKVKAHRVLNNLIAKGIIEKEKLGKTNAVRLHKDFLILVKAKG